MQSGPTSDENLLLWLCCCLLGHFCFYLYTLQGIGRTVRVCVCVYKTFAWKSRCVTAASKLGPACGIYHIRTTHNWMDLRVIKSLNELDMVFDIRGSFLVLLLLLIFQCLYLYAFFLFALYDEFYWHMSEFTLTLSWSWEWCVQHTCFKKGGGGIHHSSIHPILHKPPNHLD